MLPLVFSTLKFYVGIKKIVGVVISNLVEESDVKRKSKLILEANFIRELIAQLARCSCGVSQQSLGIAVHERDGKHYRFLRLGGLELKPARGLITGPIVERPLEAVFTVRSVTRWTFTNKSSQVVDKLLTRSKAADTQ